MLLALGIGCAFLVLPRAQRPFGFEMVACEKDTAGRWVGTFLLTNRSTRLVPTFAVSPPPLTPKPDEGEPMYWIETASTNAWRTRVGFAGLGYSRVLPPGSTWTFQIPLEPKDQPKRIRLTYILGRVELPRGIEALYLKLRPGTGPRPFDASPRYLECHLPMANKGLSREAKKSPP